MYLGINAFWEPVQMNLPRLPENRCWIPMADTARGKEAVIEREELLDQGFYVMHPRSVCVFTVKEL